MNQLLSLNNRLYCRECLQAIPDTFLFCPECAGLVKKRGHWVAPESNESLPPKAEQPLLFGGEEYPA